MWQTVILRTYEAAISTKLFDAVFVVTDSILIYNEIINNGGKAIMSKNTHESGSDRIAEAIENLDVDIVINIQGDEPFINREPLANVIEVFRNDFDAKVDLASLMFEVVKKSDIENPNNVKVVVDQNGFALYFSRSVIPYPRDINSGVRYMKHIGIYAFRKKALLDFYRLPMKSLEASEKLEQLRYLEFGKRIKMIETDKGSIGIDTLEDLEEARKLFR